MFFSYKHKTYQGVLKMFGSNFKYEDQALKLNTGAYDVTLERPYETDINGYHVLKFPFTVDGVNERTNPDNFVLFDTKEGDSQEKVKMFIKRASKIKACFILKGRFAEENYVAWTGKKGKIYIAQDDAGFMNVRDFYPNENLTAADKVQL